MYKDLDPLLHSQLRLAIMSLLVKSRKLDFTTIKGDTKSTAGNLSIQLKKLETAKYIKIKKSFKNNYPLTEVSLTNIGLNAFENYVNCLKKYLEP